MSGVLDSFDQLLGRRVSMRAMFLVRIAAGPVALLHLWPFVDDARNGHIYRDTFYEPYAGWWPELPRDLYVAVLVLGAVAAVTTALGLFTRASTITLFAVVTYNVLCSTTHFHHNRAYLIIVLAAIAVAPSGRRLSLDAWLRRRRGLPPADPRAPGWPLWLLRVEVSVVYVASGFSKLVDPDWIGGTVTQGRMLHVRDRIISESPLPEWGVDILTDATFHSVIAPVIVLTELFIGLGFWSRRTRYAALWTAVVFHLMIELSASVQVFSYLALSALVVWAVPSTRDRTVVVDPATTVGRRTVAAVGHLDWLARFEVRTVTDGEPPRVLDRDGTELTGPTATRFVASRLLPIAWFALPLLLLPSSHGERPGVEHAAV
jgi:uncharacterized membrane protein YphA (DoxX/SURF4 family)